HRDEERGVQCVKALRGAFAVALWDERLQRLLLARDQLGLVPLCSAADGRRLAAASSLPALAALPALVSAWDPAALETFVTFGLVRPPSTVYAAIRQLGPGEMGLWEDGRLRTQRYWQLTFPERLLKRADLPRLIREQMLDALRLRQAGRVSGLLLSGGLDAAALLALAAADRRLPARAYTAAFADGDQELGAAAEHAARAGVDHVAVGATPDWPAALDALLAAGRLGPLERYARAVSHVLPEEREALYTPETLAVLGEARPWDTLGRLFADAASAGATDPADTIHYAELTLRLPARAVAARA